MEINWFTVIAQVVNFFILVWLLKRFLYTPILSAIDERESKIATQLKDAAVTKAEAQQEQEDFQEKNLDFDQEKKTMMAKAVAEAAQERQQLVDDARAEADLLASVLAEASQEKRQNEQKAQLQQIQREVFAIARKALADLASAGLEEHVTKAFIKRLKAQNEEEVARMKVAFVKTKDPLLVRSAFLLPEKPQQALKQAIEKVLDAPVSLTFSVSPSLIAGMELRTQSYKLAWSISEYLHAFEDSISTQNEASPPPPEVATQHA